MSGSGRRSVLHVVAPAHVGGLERVVCLLTAGLRERGCEAAVLAFVDEGEGENHPFVRELRELGVPVDAVALPHRGYGAERRSLRAAMCDLKPSVVHTHGTRVDVIDTPAARRLGVPTVSTVHGFIGGDLKNRLYEVLHRRALRKVDAVIAVSGTLAGDLSRAGIPRSRIHVVPNGWRRATALLPKADARRRLGVEAHPGRVLGWVGRLSSEKGPDLFVDALARLGDPAVRAVVVGDGPDRGMLARRAEALGVSDRIVWAGAVHGASRTFAAFDAFVLSSRTEGTPIALFEAVDAGVPVVATAVGGVPEVLGADGGALVPPGDVAGLAEGIRSTLQDRVGAANRARRAADRLAAMFGFEAWIDRHEDLYASVARTSGERATP